MAGAAILDELPTPVGLALWKCFRGAMAWTVDATVRAGSSAAAPDDIDVPGMPEEIGAALRLLGNPSEPGTTYVEAAAMAALAVAEWAERSASPATQLAFTQLAALLRPTDAKLAYLVGRLAREQREGARAESWLRNAIHVARGADWDTYVRAHLSLVNLYLELGNHPGARALAWRALRTSRRRGVGQHTGPAYHVLFVISAEAQEWRDAHELALNALHFYGTEHPRIPALAHDVARYWSAQGQMVGDFSSAEEVAGQALGIAVRHGLGQTRVAAETELDAARAETGAASARPVEGVRSWETAQRLAGSLVESLVLTAKAG